MNLSRQQEFIKEKQEAAEHREYCCTNMRVKTDLLR
jgi:hypothetical protein